MENRAAKGQWVDHQVERRELYNGFGTTMSASIEFALAPVIFGAMGYGLDRALGLWPILTTVFAIVGVVAGFVRTWYRYDAQMKVQEAAGAWNPRPATSASAGVPAPPKGGAT